MHMSYRTYTKLYYAKLNYTYNLKTNQAKLRGEDFPRR